MNVGHYPRFDKTCQQFKSWYSLCFHWSDSCFGSNQLAVCLGTIFVTNVDPCTVCCIRGIPEAMQLDRRSSLIIELLGVTAIYGYFSNLLKIGQKVPSFILERHSSGFYCDKLSQANALQSECLLADCANGLSFADNLLGGQHVNSTANININNERRSNVQGETKKQRTLESLRKKRLSKSNSMLIGLKNDIQSITEEQKRQQNEVAVWKGKFYQE